MQLNVYKRFRGMSADKRQLLHQSYRTLLDASLAESGFAAGPSQLWTLLHFMFPHDLPLLPGEPAAATAPAPVVPPPAVGAANVTLSAERQALLKDIVQALAGQGQVQLNVYNRFRGMSANERQLLHQSYRTLLVASLADVGFAAGPNRLRKVFHVMFPDDLSLLPGGWVPGEPAAPLLKVDHNKLLEDILRLLDLADMPTEVCCRDSLYLYLTNHDPIYVCACLFSLVCLIIISLLV